MYTLFSSRNKVICQGTLPEIMEELFKIIEDNGFPKMKFNVDMNATEYMFEGNYCDFSIYLHLER